MIGGSSKPKGFMFKNDKKKFVLERNDDQEGKELE